MAIIFLGSMTCALCDEVLKEEQELVSTSAFIDHLPLILMNQYSVTIQFGYI
jgi:hypothetical protein